MNATTQAPPARRNNARSRPHWSYSQINQYMRCPLQYYFERVLKLPRQFTASGLLFGSAVHEALAEFHFQLTRGANCSEREIHEHFLLAWTKGESIRPVKFGKGENRDDLIQKGIALLDIYLAEEPPKDIIGVEQEMVVPLYTSRGELLHAPLIAVLDLVCQAGDGLRVIEIKTSKRKYGEMELDTALQATCYINAVRERYGKAVELQYVVLLKTKTPRIQRLDTDRTSNDIARLGDTVQQIQKAIEVEAFYPIESPLNCSGCAFRKPCKEWQGSSLTQIDIGSNNWER